MEQEVHTRFSVVCCTCLSADRDLFMLNSFPNVFQIFELMMLDFGANGYGEITLDSKQLVCWECLAILKKFYRFKYQVHSAQEHLRIMAMSGSEETVDHTYMAESLSTLEACTKQDYDKIFLYYTQEDWPPQSFMIDSVSNLKNDEEKTYELTDVTKDTVDSLEIDDHMLEVPEIVLENQMSGVMSRIMLGIVAIFMALMPEMVLENPVSGVMSRIVVGTDAMVSSVESIKTNPDSPAKIMKVEASTDSEPSKTSGYVVDYMSEDSMLSYRETMRQKVQYADSVFKCELCIIGFYNQQQVEDHFVSDHSPKAGSKSCRVCYVYIDEADLSKHVNEHYAMYKCRFCGHKECNRKNIELHVAGHKNSGPNTGVIKIGNSKTKKKGTQKKSSRPSSGTELRKLLSKTTIEGYQCLECDMFFKNSRARKNHVARFHREGFQCDHCKKRFVNRTTLATHLRLHEGPLPRRECYICHKMVREIQLKYHIQRHENKAHYECQDCNKVFSHMATYQAHLKYSRAHATDSVLKFPCPMCNKGYPTKDAMQDHFNYQHLGKTSHKCPVCEKPIASKANVEKHMLRMHGQKREKPRNHVCQTCGKGFTDKKALNQHEVIHSGERPLACEICHQTFKQKASLYTHKKRVHKIFPSKKMVEYMEPKIPVQS